MGRHLRALMNRFHLQAADRSFNIVIKSRAAGPQIPHLADLCRGTPWNPNLTLHCHSSCGPDQLSLCGGLAEARNRVQTCLRLAIDAGAGGGLVIPPVVSRAEDGLTPDLRSGSVCPGSLWDIAGMRRTLGNWCPGLKIRTTAACRSDGDDSTSGAVGTERGQQHVKTVNLPTRRYDGPHHNTATSSSSSSSTLSFGKLVQGFLRKASLDAEPVIVRYGDPHLAWDYAQSGEMATLRRELFHSMKHNSSLIALGRAVFDQIAEAAGGVDGRFIGVHLRGEGDLPKTGSAGVEAQLREFVKAIKGIASPSGTSSTPAAGPSPDDLKKRYDNDATLDDDSKIRTVYVSCSDRAAIQKFREMLETLNYTVYDWRALLGPPPGISDSKLNHQRHPGNGTLLAQIEALGSDQRDVVEYEVLVRARYWIGVSTSPLPTLIAYARGGVGATENLEEQKEKNTVGWFDRYINPRSSKTVGVDGDAARREYASDMRVRGDQFTKLLVVSRENVTDYFFP
ncbi:hypothetical protein PG997_007511 [Apiospora hydei]|uniref:Uncharacterized protein n=1 Tax=Apiospora hydei TaxID=1337664 RepID=A0ABR1W886_9PEZI